MSISAINSSHSVASSYEAPKPAPAPTAHSASSIPTDTVTLSSAAQHATSAGDVDHDGDSH